MPGRASMTTTPQRIPAYVWWAIELLVVVVLALAARRWQQEGTARGVAPELAVADLRGARVHIGGGRPVLVHFMAEWCGVCDLVEASVVSVSSDHEVIFVASRSGAEAAVRAWVEASPLASVRVVPDPDGRLAARWGVHSYPTDFYVDGQGAISMVEVGYTTELGMRARLWWAR
jgi:thiol-disulfide isomerase/thioredoxin